MLPYRHLAQHLKTHKGILYDSKLILFSHIVAGPHPLCIKMTKYNSDKWNHFGGKNSSRNNRFVVPVH